jgi:hypothetical protein
MPPALRVTRFLKEYRPVLLLSGAMLAISAWLQLQVEWSPMILSEEIWHKKLEFHLTYTPFAVRFFQSYATLGLRHLLDWPIRESFFAVQFALALLLGPLFYRYLRALNFDKAWSRIGVLLFYSAYPILGAHFAPTYTWDDFWMYAFLILSLIFIIRQQPLLAITCFTLGCFARETMLFFYPILLLSSWWLRPETRRWQWLTGLLMPAVLYGLFYVIMREAVDPLRWELAAFNFGNVARSTDSIVSLIIAFGFLWLLMIIGLATMLRQKPSQTQERILVWGLLTSLPPTVIATLLFSLARETRIFFPPFVFVIPLSLVALRSICQYVREHWSRRTFILVSAGGAAVTLAAALSGHSLVPATDFTANAGFRRHLAGFHLGLMLVILGGYTITWLRSLAARLSRSRQKTSG